MDIVNPHIDSYMASRLVRFDEPVLLEMEAEAAARNFPIVGRNVGVTLEVEPLDDPGADDGAEMGAFHDLYQPQRQNSRGLEFGERAALNKLVELAAPELTQDGPIVALKAAADRGEARARARIYHEIFGLSGAGETAAGPEDQAVEPADSPAGSEPSPRGPHRVIQGGKES
jgi:hypothetical protein